jgi:hypothetical protein
MLSNSYITHIEAGANYLSTGNNRHGRFTHGQKQSATITLRWQFVLQQTTYPALSAGIAGQQEALQPTFLPSLPHAHAATLATFGIHVSQDIWTLQLENGFNPI